MFKSTGLFVWIIIVVVTMCIFNWSNVAMVKQVSCVFTGFMGSMPTITVWIVSILIGLEDFELQTSGIQMIGFVFLILGNFTYNEILEIKMFGLNKMMSKYQNMKDGPTGSEYESLQSKQTSAKPDPEEDDFNDTIQAPNGEDDESSDEQETPDEI